MPAKKSTPVKATAVKSATKAPSKAPVKAAAPAKKPAPKKVAAAPAKVAPAKAAPAKAAPAKAAPAKKVVAAPVPVKAAPVKKTVPAKAAPATKAAPAKKAVAAAPAKKAPAKSAGKVSVLFEKFSPDSHSVEIVGSFNGWTVGKNPLKKDATGVWSGKLSLEPGTYEYKFVFDGLSYEADPGREQVWGPFGANNILIVV